MADDPKPTQDVDLDQVRQDITQELKSDFEEKLNQVIESVDERVTQAKGEAAKEVEDRIVKAVTGESEEALPWEKDGRTKPGSYRELLSESDRRAEERIQTELDKREEASTKAQKDKEEADRKAQAKQASERNAAWDRELQSLADDKIIPDISDEVREKIKKGQTITEEDKQDPGLKARRDIIGLAKEHTPQGVVPNLELIGHKYYKGKTTQSGAAAPVFGNTKPGVGQQDDGPGYTYEEIHNTPTEELVKA